jgi:hypothetical protein
MALTAIVVAFGAVNVATPHSAEAGFKTKAAKKVLKGVSKGAAKFERKMRGKGKFGRAMGRAVGGLGRGAGKLRSGISKVQGGVKKVVGKVCRGPCGKVLAKGREVKKKINRFQRKAVGKLKSGLKKVTKGRKHSPTRSKFASHGASTARKMLRKQVIGADRTKLQYRKGGNRQMTHKRLRRAY